MAIDDARSATTRHVTADARFGADDRYCRHCREIALVFDPSAGRPRCRTCGELA
ncbi:hypothetical protein EGH21_04160 [Halomicroarcula sp. F13]|uniref:DksA C4-type domain-containing protein n=1 Tax=Haloarcula rubra TaxID=2487747 RepID=A0AAW4PNF7_9EURY|nr:hypothetical protein [Halomicroarcula rubra]MBX0322224.1 hypothetical protein [Halomicroarcula rubra]